GAMLVAFVLAGCAVTPPANSPTTPMQPTGDEGGQRYSLFAGSTVEVGFTSVSASSTSGTYPINNLLDDNPSTAWGPAADPNPTLFFTLDGDVLLSAIAIKLSLGTSSSPSNQRVLVDVDVRQNGGDWTTIATGLTPQETILDTLDVPDTMADEVRLRFRATSGNDINDLLVCQAAFFAFASKPTPTPSVTPTPTPTPTATPTATPTPEVECCKVTGGGWVPPNEGEGRVSFGFVAMTNPGRGITGNIQVVDHTTRTTYHGRVDTLTCEDNTATFGGTLRGGGRFTAIVTDNGEPGDSDIFSFDVTGGGFNVSNDLGGDEPGGGNIQFHEVDCD
ncbi:MAG: post-COAP-1 domain-containing protein, partial [Candidatus Sericytochromatia bacterium]